MDRYGIALGKLPPLAKEVRQLPIDSWSEENWSVPVDTTEELLAELDRQMAGLKDKHDRFIDAYMEDDEVKQAFQSLY